MNYQKKCFFILLFYVFFIDLCFCQVIDEYRFKRQIIIENKNSQKIPKLFTINFTINTFDLIKENKVNPDCSDLKIFDSSLTQKDRIINNCGEKNTEIYFRLDEDIEVESRKYYLYYGNKKEILNNINKSNVYYFFDDFESYNLNLQPPYNVWYSNGGLWKIDNSKSFSGEKSVFENGQYTNWITLNNTFNIENFTYIAYGMIGKEANVWSFGVSFNIQNQTGFRYQAHWEYQYGSGIGGWTFQLRKVFRDLYEHYTLAAVYPYNYSLYNIEPPITNKWYEFKIIRSYPNIKVFFNKKLIFDVNDSTFKNGSIGFSRYSNIADSTRTSWYDDATVMLYMDPWPEVYLGPEEEIKPINISVDISKIFYVKNKQKINVHILQNNMPISNLTLNDFNISIPNSSIEISSFKNYKNGTYSFEINIQTKYLGKKSIIIKTPYKTIQEYFYILTYPNKNSIIVTNDNWKNFIMAASTNKTVLITNSSTLLELYKPEQIFLLDTNVQTEKEHYYIDRETLSLIFFQNKEIIATNEKNTAIISSSLQIPIIIEPTQEILQLLNPKKIYNFTYPTEAESLYLSKLKTTNYIILANQDSEKSILASSLAFKHNGFVILFSGDANKAKQKLKEKIDFTKYQLTIDYRFKNKVFLTLIDAPFFFVDDPVNDGLLDYDGDKIKTDIPYSDINDDGYLDLSVSRLNGSLESLTHQIYFEPKKDKQALIISVYDTLPVNDIFYSVPLMQYSQSLRSYLSSYGFNITSLVEKRSEKDEYNYQDINSLLKDVNSYIKNNDFNSLLKQIKTLFSTFNEAVYLLVEYDWSSAFDKLLKDKTFALKHLPIYTKENFLSEIRNKDIILYMAFGNKTHFFTPDNLHIPISELPNIPSFVYLYYSNSYESVPDIQNKKAISILTTTSSIYTPQSSYSSYLLLKNFNGEIAYILNNGKNDLYKYYKSIKNISFFDPNPYLKEYYARTLFGDPAKIFDPFIENIQSENIYFDGQYLNIKLTIQPNYTIIQKNGTKYAYFKDADYIDEIPIYKKTIILPKDSIINNLSFSSQKIQENVLSFGIQENYWYDVYKLLDNRTVIDIIIFPITSSGEILQNITVSISYKNNIEITNIAAKDYLVNFTIYSSENKEVKSIILIESEYGVDTINKTIYLSSGINNYNILLPKRGSSCYSISLIVEADKIVGPKYTYFCIEPKISKIILPLKKIKSLNFSRFLESKISPKESVNIFFEEDKKIINYKDSCIELNVEIAKDKLIGKFLMNNKKLLVKESSYEKIYEFSSSQGKAKLLISNGKNEESFTDINTLNEMKKMISLYNEIMLKIEEQYT
ncbi:MAG: DUF2341 domain-containing protein [Candidatus Aenigmarchaeota archaeon]|nr:DUF2341 domain-containing protein [Candidatus Aenigmarchaeota archaeon]